MYSYALKTLRTLILLVHLIPSIRVPCLLSSVVGIGLQITQSVLLSSSLQIYCLGTNSRLTSAKGFKWCKAPPHSVHLAITNFSPANFGKTFYIVITFFSTGKEERLFLQPKLFWKCGQTLEEVRSNDFWNVTCFCTSFSPNSPLTIPHSPSAPCFCTLQQLIVSVLATLWAPSGHGTDWSGFSPTPPVLKYLLKCSEIWHQISSLYNFSE